MKEFNDDSIDENVEENEGDIICVNVGRYGDHVIVLLMCNLNHFQNT